MGRGRILGPAAHLLGQVGPQGETLGQGQEARAEMVDNPSGILLLLDWKREMARVGG